MDNQRLTVQYSIRADEMEIEIKRLVSRSLSKLDALNKQFHDDLPEVDLSVDNNDINGFLKFVNHIRDQLAEIDFSLNERSSVAYGHHTYLTNKNLPPTQAHVEPAEEVDDG